MPDKMFEKQNEEFFGDYHHQNNNIAQLICSKEVLVCSVRFTCQNNKKNMW